MDKLVLAFALAFVLPAWAATEWMNAEIRNLDMEKSRIGVKPKRINRIDMDSMTMKFDANKLVAQTGLRAGDAARFQVRVRSDTLDIIALEKRP